MLIQMITHRNMFLAASPYFQHRFAHSPRLLSAYSPSLLSVSTVTNLVAMLILTHLQSNANYPNRIIWSLLINITTFTLLAISTVAFRSVSEGFYFFFLMSMVFLASLAAAFCQNGVFAYVSGFGEGAYTQAIMTGQGVAGVLPCIAQIISVLSMPSKTTKRGDGDLAQDGKMGTAPPVAQESGKSAFAYFLTATLITVAALLAFIYLLRRHPDAGTAAAATTTPKSPTAESFDDESPFSTRDEPISRKTVGMWALYKKLHWLANAVFLTFAITMFFPVFTQQIHSTYPLDSQPRLLQPSCFIPLAFLFWNTGDLAGRLVTLLPSFSRFTAFPRTMFAASVIRVVWIPLYLLCNTHGEGAVVRSDFFYLVIVQLLFGLTNGFLGSICMMGASAEGTGVESDEREAAGGFMGLMLVGGLTVGSLASFGVA